MSTWFCSKIGPQVFRTVVLLPIEANPLAHEYGGWWKKTNFHFRVVLARSFVSQLVCVDWQQLLLSRKVKCASPWSKEKYRSCSVPFRGRRKSLISTELAQLALPTLFRSWFPSAGTNSMRRIGFW